MRGERSGSVLLAAALLLLAACGGDSGGPASSSPNDAATIPAEAGSGRARRGARRCGPDASDAGATDAAADAAPDAAPYEPPAVELPDPESDEPFFLSATGLYTDIAGKELAPDLLPFEPGVPAVERRRRQAALAAPARAATQHRQRATWTTGSSRSARSSARSSRATASGSRRGSSRAPARARATTGWARSCGTTTSRDARFVPDGRDERARHRRTTCPTVKNCCTCHDGEPGRVLGFSAVQQPRRRGRAARPSAVAPATKLPGDAAVAARARLPARQLRPLPQPERQRAARHGHEPAPRDRRRAPRGHGDLPQHDRRRAPVLRERAAGAARRRRATPSRAGCSSA